MKTSKKVKAEQENYLDYIPKHNELFPYQMKENNRVEVKVTNRGMFKARSGQSGICSGRAWKRLFYSA